MTSSNPFPVRVVTRTQLLALTRAVAGRGENYGRPVEWIEANVQPDALIPIYYLLTDRPDRLRCVVVPLLIGGRRGFYSIDLRPHELSSLPRLSRDDSEVLLREFSEYIPHIPLTAEQLENWKAAGYDWPT